MDSYEELLHTWNKSASVMHIVHHKAAAKCSKIHHWLGALNAALGAIVASAVFVAASQSGDRVYLLVTAVVSLTSAVLSAANSSLDYGGKAQRHYASAVAFQGLRRQLEEEIVQCRNGRPKESYEHLRAKWTATLDNAIPVPQELHDLVKRGIDKEYAE